MRDSLGEWGAPVLVAALIAVVAVAGTAAMSGDDQPSGEDVLNETSERYENAESVVGTADVTVENDSTSESATVEFAAAGEKARVVVTRDGETYRAGTNGTVAWYVGPNRSEAWEVDALRESAGDLEGIESPRDVLDEALAEDVDVELVRETEVDGTSAYVLEATPTNESHDGQATLWVATEDSRLLRVEATDGTNRTVVDFRETRFNESVHDSTFDPPADRISVTAVDRYDAFEPAQANVSIDLPRLDVAAFEEAVVVERAEDTSVVQRYDADGQNVSVVSTTADREFDPGDDARTVTVDGQEATVTSVRNATVVYWRADGVTTAVIVDADEDRAIELARALADDDEDAALAAVAVRAPVGG